MIRGELLKVLTTRTLLGYTAAGVVLAALNVVVVAVASGELDSIGEKREALSGLPILLAVFGIVGAAVEFRHRTAAPAALAAHNERATLLLARTGVYAATGLALAAAMTPRMDGVEAAARLAELDPAPRVLVLTTFDLDEYVFGALRADDAPRSRPGQPSARPYWRS
jgi:hypothetical protein